jgi:hypothetical protein
MRPFSQRTNATAPPSRFFVLTDATPVRRWCPGTVSVKATLANSSTNATAVLLLVQP